MSGMEHVSYGSETYKEAVERFAAAALARAREEQQNSTVTPEEAEEITNIG